MKVEVTESNLVPCSSKDIVGDHGDDATRTEPLDNVITLSSDEDDSIEGQIPAIK